MPHVTSIGASGLKQSREVLPIARDGTPRVVFPNKRATMTCLAPSGRETSVFSSWCLGLDAPSALEQRLELVEHHLPGLTTQVGRPFRVGSLSNHNTSLAVIVHEFDVQV